MDAPFHYVGDAVAVRGLDVGDSVAVHCHGKANSRHKLAIRLWQPQYTHRMEVQTCAVELQARMFVEDAVVYNEVRRPDCVVHHGTTRGGYSPGKNLQ